MTENEVAQKIVDAAFHIHNALGPGLFESVYQNVLTHELRKRNLWVEPQVALTVVYEDLVIEEAFRADLFVEKLVIVELKAVENVTPVHKKQLLTYLKLSGIRLGLLINFNVVLIKHGIIRVANGLPDEK